MMRGPNKVGGRAIGHLLLIRTLTIHPLVIQPAESVATSRMYVLVSKMLRLFSLIMIVEMGQATTPGPQW